MNSRQIRDLNHAARKAGKPPVPKKGESPTDKQHKERPPQAQNRPTSTRALRFLGTGFLAVLTIVGVAYQFRPEVTVDRDISLDVNDPFATQFLVTNGGLLAIYDVRFSCTINNQDLHNVTMANMRGGQTAVPVLESRESATKNCALRSASYPYLSELFFDVSFTPKWYWQRLVRRTRFVNVRDSEGHLKWLKQAASN